MGPQTLSYSRHATYPYKYEAEYVMTKDNSRTPNTYGYYTSLKEVPQRSKGETYNGSWQAFAMNDYVFRYTDVNAGCVLRH